MRKIIPTTTLVMIIAIIIAAGGMFADTDKTDSTQSNQVQSAMHDALGNHFAHKPNAILPRTYTMSKDDETNLRIAISSYLGIVDALSDGDGNAVDESALEMASSVAGIKKAGMDNATSLTWENHAQVIKETLVQLQETDDIEKKRSYFGHLSEIAYCTTKSFRIRDANLRALFCPKALSGKGAFWLDDSAEIRNPYFSHPVTNCIQVTEYMGKRKKHYISPFGRTLKND